MTHSLTWKRSTLSLSKHKSDISDISLREKKNFTVRSQHYQQILKFVSIFISQPELHLQAAQTNKAFCQELLKKKQSVSKNSLFNNDLFKLTCEDIANWNKTKVIQDIEQLIVFTLEKLFCHKAKHLKHLIKTVNESWIKFISLVKGPYLQLNFVVKLKLFAFISD